MKKNLNVLVYCLLTLIIGCSVGATAYADSDRSSSGRFGKKIAGTYLVREGEPNGALTFFRLITLTADGNWLSTESHQQTVDFGFSDQQGVWKKSGRREITATVLDFDFDLKTSPLDPIPTGVTRIRFVMTFSKKYKEVRGKFFGKDFALDQDPLNPDETPNGEFEGIFFGKRVTVNLEEDD